MTVRNLEHKRMEYIKQLAEEHWSYIEKVILTHQVFVNVNDVPSVIMSTEDFLKLVGFHYQTAMIHGYTHGSEDKEDE